LNDSGSNAFSKTAEGVETALIQAMQGDQQLAGFRALLLVSFLMRIVRLIWQNGPVSRASHPLTIVIFVA
jgi:hypothetical protein